MAAFGLAYAVLPAPSLGFLPPPIEVRVGGSFRLLPPAVNLGTARTMLGLNPRSGHLLDVEGKILERRAYHGHIEVNGEPASDSRPLRSGDVVEVVDERDHFEAVTIVRREIPGGRVANPQTHLGTQPGEQVITRGAVSGKLVSSSFQPTGAAEVPRAVALTFDDGPSPEFTPRILEILERHEAVATFFMVGYLAERYPDLVKRVVNAGMAVGNHSHGHPTSAPFADLPRRRMEEEIRGGRRALEALGARPQTFRPPGGSWSEGVVRAARDLGERVVLWSIDSRDWQRPPPRRIVKEVLRGVGPGSIILLHDGGGDRSRTVKALPRILRGLKRRGLAFQTL